MLDEIARASNLNGITRLGNTLDPGSSRTRPSRVSSSYHSRGLHRDETHVGRIFDEMRSARTEIGKLSRRIL